MAAATILRRANSGEREELSEVKEYQAASGKITRELSDQLAKREWRAAVSGTFEKLAKKQVDGHDRESSRPLVRRRSGS